MPISEEILSQLKCCFFNDGHIAIEPIYVSCGAVGCKECIATSNMEEIDCYSCKGKHPVNDLKNILVIKPMENMVKSSLNDLFEYAKGILEKSFNLLKGKIYK